MADAKRVIRLEYKAYLADSEKMYDTTDEAAAKEAGIYDEKFSYKPMAYIIGSNKLFPALDKAIASAEVGKEFTVEIPCEEGAGARNPKFLEIHPINEFYKAEIMPQTGMTVTLGNRTGTIMTVGAGRVKVDFNNPLAGHDLRYVMTVTEEVTDNAKKAETIVEADFGPADDFKFEFPGKKVVVTLPEITKFHQEWPVARFKVVSDLRDAFGVDTIEFVEIWTAAKKADEKKADEKKADEKKADEKKADEKKADEKKAGKKGAE